MNKLKKNALLLATALLTVGCTDEISLQQMDENPTPSSISSSHFVTYDAIKTLTQGQGKSTRGVQETESIIDCYVDNTSDTLLYICSKADSGWVMYSSDTRVPIILAESGSGDFSKSMENEEFAAWIATIAEDMKAVREASDEELNFSEEEIQQNESFWDAILDLKDTTFKKKIFYPKPAECVESFYVTNIESTETIPHLTTTEWSQNDPYNKACPFRSNSKYVRSPAGCVPIAAAQILFFLHDTLGVPQTAPSEAYCTSSNNETPYNWEQTNYTEDIWDKMRINGEYTAPLVADIGRRVGVKYGDLESPAPFKDLVEKVFSPYGISCEYNDYKEQYISSSLLKNMPVLLAANDDNGNGHVFIADAYKKANYVTKFIQVYEYPNVYDSNGKLIVKPNGWVEETICSRYSNVISIGMNWGWGSWQQKDDEWFTLTGDWIKTVGDNSMNYHNNREIIYNWDIKN